MAKKKKFKYVGQFCTKEDLEAIVGPLTEKQFQGYAFNVGSDIGDKVMKMISRSAKKFKRSGYIEE